MSIHRYKSLDPSTPEIRLVVLEPGDHDAELRGQTTHVSLDDNPKYEALSYTWGLPWTEHTLGVNGLSLSMSLVLQMPDNCRMVLDNCSFTIGSNLEQALRDLRRSDAQRTLWIDAICIDQNNIEERSQQVQKMRLIYERAACVLAWLGEAGDSSELAMELLKNIDSVNVEELRKSSETPPNWKALHKLWKRPYWKRVWIIQELVSAKNASIGCGGNWLPLRNFGRALALAAENPTCSAIIGNNEHATAFTLLALTEPRQLAKRDLHSLIYTSYLSEATDIRDKLYGIIGLAPEEDQRSLSTDYHATLAEVCGRLVKYLSEQDKSLKILSRNQPIGLRSAPSWAPKFFQPAPSDVEWAMFEKSYQAAGTSLPSIQLSDDMTLLTVKGFTVDIVETAISHVKNEVEIISDNSAAIRNMERAAQEALDRYQQHPNPFAQVEPQSAFWRTLLANHGVSIGSFDDITYPAQEGYQHVFEVLLGRASVPEDFDPHNLKRSTPGPNPRLLWYQYVTLILWVMKSTLEYRQFFTTKSGLIGVGPRGMKSGDIVCVLFGWTMPFVLRAASRDRFSLLGDAYVHGIMDGQMMHGLAEKGEGALIEREFVLI